MRLIILLILIMTTFPLSAQTAPRLDSVTNELESIVADLEVSQAQSKELWTRLAQLETLSAEHQATLAAQDKLLNEYHASVKALEAHDQASLNLASSLKDQLETERRLNSWLWPAVGVAVAAAIVEGLALGLRR